MRCDAFSRNNVLVTKMILRHQTHGLSGMYDAVLAQFRHSLMQPQMSRIAILLLALVPCLIPGTISAQAGVGVNLGSIQVDEDLAPGGRYYLPFVGVINTGQEASDYSVRVNYRTDQEQLRPPAEWFSFSPAIFHLEAGELETVNIQLDIPITARPGEYFAHIEAFAVMSDAPGVVLGVAAATKLSFSVRSSNRLQASWQWLYHRIDDAAPYSYFIPGLMLVLGVGYWMRRRLRIRIHVERRD